MIYLFLSSHRTPIQIHPQQKKTTKNSRYHFESTLTRMQLFIHLQHPNYTSNSLDILILTTYLTFLLLLSLPWFLNLEDLKKNLKTLWFPFVLAKGKASHNTTLEIFSQEAIFIMKQGKQTTSQVNTSCNFQNQNTYNDTWINLN